MAGRASDIVQGVGGTQEVCAVMRSGVAFQANIAGLCHVQCLEADDFGNVSPALDVGRPGTVAILAPVLARLDQGIMRSFKKTLVVKVLVAGFAGIRAHIAGLRRSLSLRRGQCWIAGRSLWRGARSCFLREQRRRQDYGENDCQ